jgi:hypothetical protein
MINQFQDLSQIQPNNKHKKKTKEIDISLLFKINNCAEISAINRNQDDIITAQGFDEPNHYQESYGLDTIKPKAKGKKVNKLALRSMDRINGFSDKLTP